jgi:hypothetical protein
MKKVTALLIYVAIIAIYSPVNGQNGFIENMKNAIIGLGGVSKSGLEEQLKSLETQSDTVPILNGKIDKKVCFKMIKATSNEIFSSGNFVEKSMLIEIDKAFKQIKSLNIITKERYSEIFNLWQSLSASCLDNLESRMIQSSKIYHRKSFTIIDEAVLLDNLKFVQQTKKLLNAYHKTLMGIVVNKINVKNS